MVLLLFNSGICHTPTRPAFYERIDKIMGDSDYELIAAAINKAQLDKQYAYPNNPYDLALTFALERLIRFMEGKPKQTQLSIMAESRGKNEDNQLKATFLDVMSKGTNYMSAMRFKNVGLNLLFKAKQSNIIGNQLADLAAYPTARYVMNPSQPNPAFAIIERKFYSSGGKRYGLKVFPK